MNIKGMFVDGERFSAVDFKLAMNIPKPGYYEITWILISGGIQTEYSYGFQVAEK